MLLLTQDQRARMIANGKSRGDHVPVVKFFNPVGAATWLFSELDEDDDILFGLCDLGFGCPEMGSASLSEIAAVPLPNAGWSLLCAKFLRKNGKSMMSQIDYTGTTLSANSSLVISFSNTIWGQIAIPPAMGVGSSWVT